MKSHVFSFKKIFLKCNIIEEFYCFILITIEMGGRGVAVAVYRKDRPCIPTEARKFCRLRET